MNKRNKNYISLTLARERLFSLWVWGLIIICLIGIFMTFARAEYSGIQSEIWSWITPLVIPNFSLMLSVYASDAVKKDDNEESYEVTYKVEKYFYNLSSMLSYIYLLLIIFFLVQELFFSADYYPLETLKLSSIILGLFQGFVTAIIGVLFFKKIVEYNNPKKTNYIYKKINNIVKNSVELTNKFFHNFFEFFRQVK